MHSFINNIRSKFEIQILFSQNHVRGNNSYSLNQDGNINSLYLDSVKLKNLDFLAPIAENLELLSLENCSIENIGSESSFSKLQKLSLNENPLDTLSYKRIAQIQSLRDLDLSLTTISDTTPLGTLNNLQSLNLSFNVDLKEVKGIEKLNSLKKLEIRFGEIESIEKIMVSDSLEYLNVRAGQISQLNGLEKYHNLKELRLDGNPISKIECLDTLQNLELLDLSHTSIPKIEGLDNLLNLKKLNISSCLIEKIEGLQNLHKLEVLDLSNQKIKKIEALEKLTKLKELDLSLNKIAKVENITNLRNLKYVLLECNQIQEFDLEWLYNLHSSCFVAMSANNINELNSIIPSNVTIQFQNDKRLRKLF